MIVPYLQLYKKYIYAALSLITAGFFCIALGTFSLYDPSFFYSVSGAATTQNAVGVFGSYLASLLLYMFGAAAWLLIPGLVLTALVFAEQITQKRTKQLIVGGSLLLAGVTMFSYQTGVDLYAGIAAGGLLGMYLTKLGALLFDAPVIYAATMLMNFVGIVLIVCFAWVRPLMNTAHNICVRARLDTMVAVVVQTCAVPWKKGKNFFRRKKEPVDTLTKLVQEIVQSELKSEHDNIFDDPFWRNYPIISVEQTLSPVLEQLIVPEQTLSDSITMPAVQPFALPPVTLFHTPESTADSAAQEALAQERAKNLEAKLELFGIAGSVTSITVGPVVTLFEYVPAQDVKVSKIVMLEDDLSLALEAHSLRIIAPIPGRAVVGFEVANAQRQTVYFSDIVAGQVFKKHKGMLPLVIGRDTIGNDIVIDLVEAPHLLVAGSTGSGKSVALNAMLTSMLCKTHPDEVRLILIDPKRLEFASFADVAHLMFPIVTDVMQAALVLRWAVKTMEERYEQLAAAGVRHVAEYHKKFGVAAMPYLVIIIDELADLMMTAGREVEELIARLAQMARASGIHLIIATQRPSVDVITGLIKVNFPSRIACKVISKVDSRTILDVAGAEKLLGKGDMLFMHHKGGIMRVHGAYVKDEEITAVINYVKQQRPVVYQELDVVAQFDDSEYDEDPLYNDVCSYVVNQEQVSISLLQRKFRIGYNRSARLIDTLEARGVLMPADGGKFRKVLRR